MTVDDLFNGGPTAALLDAVALLRQHDWSALLAHSDLPPGARRLAELAQAMVDTSGQVNRHGEYLRSPFPGTGITHETGR